MIKERYKKITFEFPFEEYTYLKVICAKQGMLMREFLTRSVLKSIAEYEEELDLKAIRKAREENDAAIPWDEAKKQLKRNLENIYRLLNTY
jgi:hypothetical protein